MSDPAILLPRELPGAAPEAADTLFGETLVREGAISREHLEEALVEQRTRLAQGRRVRLGEVLVERGLIAPERVREFLHLAGKQILQCPRCGRCYNVTNWAPGREVSCPRCACALAPFAVTETIDAVHQRTPSADAAPAPPGAMIGRYRLLVELGRGGMGVVWKAWDTELKRVVALKRILSEPDPALVERFVREARAAARLSHPGIVAVHDVGVSGGTHYFTSDFIEGIPLDKRPEGPMPGRQAMEIVKAVAEALDHAHLHGIVHRDVKPANILLDGAGRPHVTDFGLAKVVGGAEESGLTVSGQLLGTPTFMSPEQARGEQASVGPASDQFSLGAVLYYLLTGRLPFPGLGVVDILGSVIERDPVPPTTFARDLPRDAATVCLRALEKDPARRYATMGEFAADLGRCIAGEAILARPESAARRLVRKALKHRWVVFPTAAAILFAAAAFVAALFGSASSRALAKTPAVTKVLSRWSRLREPLGRLEAVYYDSAPAAERRRRAADPMAEVERFARETPPDSASQATMDALVGWARQLSGDTDGGLRQIRRSQEEDPDVPFGFLMEALSLLASYVEQYPMPPMVQDAGRLRIGDPDPETDKLREMRERVQALVAEALKRRVWGREGAEDFQALLSGIRALLAGDAVAAERDLTSALLSSDLQAYVAGIRLARARARYLRTDFADGLADLAEVARLRPGQIEVPLFVAQMKLCQGMLAKLHGQDGRDLLREAQKGFEGVLARDPARLSAVLGRGDALWWIGETELAQDLDPQASLEAAVAAFDEALTRDPGCLQALNNRALARLDQGLATKARGQDATQAYQDALADLGRVIERDPRRSSPFVNRANVEVSMARAQFARGSDVRVALQGAIADADAALRLYPGSFAALVLRGEARTIEGEYEGLHGESALSSFDAAARDFEAAHRLDPGDFNVRLLRATALAARARDGTLREIDPRPAWEEALREYGELLRERPDWGPPHLYRAALLRQRAEFDSAGDPASEPDLQLALKDLEEAARRPHDPVILLTEGARIRLDLVSVRTGRGEDVRALLDAGIKEGDDAVRSGSDNSCGWCWRGATKWLLGRSELLAGRDPRPCEEAAIADLTEALKRDGSNWYACRYRGLAWKQVAGYELLLGADPMKSYEAALSDLDRALSLAPREPSLLLDRASVEHAIASAMELQGRDPREQYARAIGDYDACEKRSVRAAALLADRALARQQLAQWEEAHRLPAWDDLRLACEDYARLLERAPGNVSAIYGSAGCAAIRSLAETHTGRDGRASAESAVSALEEFLRSHPADPLAVAYRVGALYALATARRKMGGDAIEAYDRAEKDSSACVERWPNTYEPWYDRSVIRRDRGEARAALGQDASADYRAALSDCDEALKRRLGWWQRRFNRGWILQDMGDLRGGLGEYEAAWKAGGELDPELKERLEAARTRLGANTR